MHVKLVKKLILLCVMLSASSFAKADDWGCQVLLCLANPSGPTAVGECVPPISKLWDALRHFKPFPTCDFANSSGSSTGPDAKNYGGNTFASAYNCPPFAVVLNADGQPVGCTYSGTVNVVIAGKPAVKMWWTMGGGTITEFNAANPTAADEYNRLVNAIAPPP